MLELICYIISHCLTMRYW